MSQDHRPRQRPIQWIFGVLNKASQMDFVRILRSLEEFLYEVMTWLVFYPRAMLRSALRPVQTLERSRAELHKPEEQQFQDSLSPPLFLMLSLVISHLIELSLHLHPFKHLGHKAETLFGSDQNLVILRSLMFAVYPLMFALEQVKDSKQLLTRTSLRGPFFGECYPASFFCLLFGIGGTLAQAMPDRSGIGWTISGAAVIWYLTVQAIWLKRFNATWRRAILVTLASFLKATMIVLIVAATVSLAVLS